jgi:hypothetical protein
MQCVVWLVCSETLEHVVNAVLYLTCRQIRIIYNTHEKQPIV